MTYWGLALLLLLMVGAIVLVVSAVPGAGGANNKNAEAQNSAKPKDEADVR